MKHTKISELTLSEDFGTAVHLKGWVRTVRTSKNVAFIALNDGSCLRNAQIVVDTNLFDTEILSKINTGTSIDITGKLVESAGQGQKNEIQATNINILGEANPDLYPIQAKRHTLEFLRENAHLRFRTNLFGAINRVRHNMIFAIHKFFNDRGFYNVHTPIITASDCEGAGEMFHVTTFDIKNPPRTPEGAIDYSKDFFASETNLTVSGQLEGELAAMALSQIYTFGPTFRAENSNTSRHLAEFWMVEPEVAFADINDNMDLAEDMLKYLVQYALDNCAEDIEFLEQRLINEEKTKPQNERSEMTLREKLQFVLTNRFERITYTQAIDILKNSQEQKKNKFAYPVENWGTDLQSEHERYLVEKHFKKPVILTDYPKEIKAFYMKQNTDDRTVAAMDVLFPQIGEIIGGSQREENYDKLITRMKETNMPVESMSWYLDTRRFGTAAHSGFGLGFERLMLFITGMTNIRDVIPFPRTPKNAEF